jgi:hypothetical protein
MSADTLFSNATIHSLEREAEQFAAFRAGPDGRIRELYVEGYPLPMGLKTVDLGGRTVLPAFMDSHVHFMAKAALAALGVNLARLEGDRIVPDSLAAVRTALEAATEGRSGLVLGYGLCLGAVAERRLPRGPELDAWFPGRPVIILSMDGHSSCYSGAALAALGIHDLAVDGILAGEAHEFNMGKISAYVLKGLGPRALARGLAATLAEAVAAGLVSIDCLEGTEDTPTDPALGLFRLLGGRLGPRLRLWMQYTDPAKAGRHARCLERKRVGGCLAWEMDGSVSSRSAAFDRNYLDRDDAGQLYRSPDAALALVRPFYELGWQTSAHAIGPRGIEAILSAYERLMDQAADSANRLRLRIDHFEFPRPDQIQRAGARRLVLTVQPGFAWADDRYIHSYAEALAPEVRKGQCPLRSLLDAGCVLALSTDAPVQPFNPFIQVAGAVRHPVPSQRLTVHEALRAYTWAGAYAAFEEHERGSLAKGKFADFVVLDTDPFMVDSDHLQDIRVLSTWHEGRKLVAPPPDLPGFLARLVLTRRRRL